MGSDIKCMYFNHRFKDKPQGKQCGWVQKATIMEGRKLIGVNEYSKGKKP